MVRTVEASLPILFFFFFWGDIAVRTIDAIPAETKRSAAHTSESCTRGVCPGVAAVSLLPEALGPTLARPAHERLATCLATASFSSGMLLAATRAVRSGLAMTAFQTPSSRVRTSTMFRIMAIIGSPVSPLSCSARPKMSATVASAFESVFSAKAGARDFTSARKLAAGVGLDGSGARKAVPVPGIGSATPRGPPDAFGVAALEEPWL